MRKKFTILFLFLCFSSLTNGQQKWSDTTKLKWIDFKGIPISGAKIDALSTTSIDCSYFFSDTSISYKIFAIFFNEESWVKCKSDYLLKHENIHFDIAEIYARKIRRYLSKSGNKNYKEIRNAISNLSNEMSRYQILYDKQTNHSLKVKEQKKWADQVANELKLLQKFRSPTEYYRL